MPVVVMVLLLLFLALPLAEVAIFIKVGGLIGVIPTLGLTILSAILGTWLVRREGLATLRIAQESVDQGRLPVLEVISGAVLLVAGFLLLTPGFLTDAVGFALLLRPIRLGVGRRVMAALARSRHGTGGPEIIEVDYSDVTPPRYRRGSGDRLIR